MLLCVYLGYYGLLWLSLFHNINYEFLLVSSITIGYSGLLLVTLDYMNYVLTAMIDYNGLQLVTIG